MSRIEFCLVLFQCLAVAQEEPKARISGTVVDVVTKAPLRKVNVVLSGGNDGRSASGTMTDAAGNFAFEKLAAGTYRVLAERSGYTRTSYGARLADGPGLPLVLSAGEQKKGVDLAMTPQAVLSGRVVDEDGDPIEGVQIQLQRRMLLNGVRRLAPGGQGQTQTNDRGEFRVSSISAGKYLVLAMHRNGPGSAMLTVEGGNTGYIPTYFPGVDRPDQAQWLEFKPGQEVASFNMVLRRSKLFRVRGRFSGAAPEANTQASFRQVVLRPKLGAEEAFSAGIFSIKSAQVQLKDGSFEVQGVNPGRYSLEVMSYAGGQRLLGKMEVTVSEAHLDGIEVPEVQLGNLSGTLKLEDESKPVNLMGVRIDLVAAEMGNPASQRLERKDGEHFEVKEVAPERYRLQVITNNQPVYLKSIRAGGKELEGGIIDMSNGGSAQVEVVVSGAIGSITGSVERESTGRPGSTVVVWREGTVHFDMMRSMMPLDPKGNFRSQPLGPGEYLLFAFEEISLMSFDPDLLKKLEAKATKVKLAEGENKTVTLKQISFQELDKALQSLP
jgi:hypothetical protein